jgi:hypothetical protein
MFHNTDLFGRVGGKGGRMRFKKYLEENYIGTYKGSVKFGEVYENPSPNEIRSMPSKSRFWDDSIRFFAYAPEKTIYIWGADAGIHDTVLDFLHTKRKLRTVYDVEGDGVLAGYAEKTGDKMSFTKGYGAAKGIGNYEWDWLSKYFRNMEYIRARIEQWT